MKQDIHPVNWFTIRFMEAWDTILNVGSKKEYSTLSDALSHIPVNATLVLIKVYSDLIQDVDVNIPIRRNLKQLQITSCNNIRQKIDFLGCCFYANGIPLIIDTTIVLEGCMLFGGSKAESGKSTICTSSDLTISGIADFVFGGGHAIGPGSKSIVQNSKITVAGRVEHLYGGGYAIQGGSVESGRIAIQVNNYVSKSLNGGSCLPGPESRSVIREISLNISGKVDSEVSLTGYTAYGSTQQVKETIQFIADKAELQGAIVESKTAGDGAVISFGAITGAIAQKHKDLLKIKNSEIKIVPLIIPIGEPGEPGKTERPGDERKPESAPPSSPQSGFPIGKIILIILIVFFLIKVFTGSNNNPNTSKQNTYVMQTTKAPFRTPTKTAVPAKTKAVSPTSAISSDVFATTVFTPTLTPVLSNTVTTTLPDMPSNTYRIGKVLRDAGLYSRKDRESDYIRTLFKDSEVSIISGPEKDYAGIFWYEVICEEFPRNNRGWIVGDFISIIEK